MILLSRISASGFRYRLLFCLLCGLGLYAPSVLAEEKEKATEEILGEEAVLEEEQAFPDLVKADETGGVMDEFGLLEEELAVDEVVSASKHRQSIFWSPSAVTVITREEIAASGAFDLADLLRRVPGMDVYRLKPAYSLVGCRSMTSEHNNLILLLVDGREAMNEIMGVAFWGILTINLEDIERVEIIRGPGSALYGANAFSAVVNVTTIPERPTPSAEAVVSGGEYSFYRTYARARDSQRLGDGTFSWGAGAGSSGNAQISDRRYQVEPARFHGYLRFQEGADLDLSLHAGGIMIPRGLIYLFFGDVLLRDASIFWTMGKAELGIGEKIRLKSQIFYTRYKSSAHGRSGLRAYDIWIANLPELNWLSHSLDGQAQLEFPIRDDLLLIGGGNLRLSVVSGKNLTLDNDMEVRGAGFVHAEWRLWEMVQATAGARLDFNTLTDAAFSPRLAVIVRPVETHSFRAAYGLAFKKPSYFESQLHLVVEEFNSATPEIVDLLAEQLGNPNLTNARVHSLEAGWMGTFDRSRLRLSADVFYNIYQNFIGIFNDVPLRFGLPDIQNATIQYDNMYSDISTVGIEVGVEYKPEPLFSVWGNLGLRDTSYGGKQWLGREPTLRINLGGRYTPSTGLRADLALHYTSAYATVLMNPVSSLQPQSTDLGDTWLLIGKLAYRTAAIGGLNLEAGLTIHLPLGEPFREFSGMPKPTSVPVEMDGDVGGILQVRRMVVYLSGTL